MPVEDVTAEKSLSGYPWATLMAVALTLVGSLILLVGESDLNFDSFTDFALAGWAVLALGRGFAAKPVVGQTGLVRTLNEVPWATVIIGIIIVTGAVVLLIGDSALTFDDYFQKCLLAAGALGIARGVAAYKADTHPVLEGEYDEEAVYKEPEFDPEVPTDEPLPEPEVAEAAPEGAVGGKAGETTEGQV